MRTRLVRLLKSGTRISSGSVVCHAAEGAGLKIGFLAARRLGPAVRRNRVKRIVRDFWRSQFPSGNYLFVVKAPAMTAHAREIREDLSGIAERWRCQERS